MPCAPLHVFPSGMISPARLARPLSSLLLALSTSLLPALLRAQPAASHAAVDSAVAARQHYSAARDAVRRNDLAEAQHALQRAVVAWPTQPAYAAAVAGVSAHRGDRSVLVGALRQLVALEAGSALLADSAVLRVAAASPDVAAALARLRVALHDVATSRVELELQDSTVFPEGIAVHPTTGALYVTSIRHRTIVERTRDGRERDVLLRGTPGIGAILAVRADPDGQHLWATTAGHSAMTGYVAADSAIAALLRIRLSDGKIIRRWELGVDGLRQPGDIALLPGGDVLVSDSRSPTLYRLRRDRDQIQTLTHPLFRSLQGMAPTGDGATVFVADYSHGLLLVDGESGDVQRVGHADSISTLGLDGIVRHGNCIIAIQNGAQPLRVVRYELAPDGRRIVSAHTLDRQPALADEPTNGAVVGSDLLYIANSQWMKYDARGARVPGTRLERPRILRLPLTPPRP